MEHTNRHEELYMEGVQLIKEHGSVSAILLQRKLCIGYADARLIIDRMLQEGVAVADKRSKFKIILRREASDEV